MKRDSGIFQKIFAGIGLGTSRVPLRSNIVSGMGGSRGYRNIGGLGRWAGQRESPLLGNAQPSTRISGYYQRHDELKSYRLIDCAKTAVNFFSDYTNNFLKDTVQEAVSIYNKEGALDPDRTERINNVLLKQLNIFEYIRQHQGDHVFYGQYASALCKSRDEYGHIIFRFEELYDATSVITKKSRDFKDGTTKETYLCRAENGKIYEVGENDLWILGTGNLHLENDLEEGKSSKDSTKAKPTFGSIENGKSVFEMILNKDSYSTSEPLFYSLILKLKELIVKELLVSLISLRDLSSVQLFLLQFDKGTPLETANELCARTTKLANTTNELASFMTSQFDVVSFIENTLSQSAKFVPDFNSTLSSKNNMIPLDKLSDKLLEIMQTLDQNRAAVLNPLGLPSSILDATSGSKWAILQQSERANSKVTSFMSSIRGSVISLVRKIYYCLYQEDIDPSLIKLHISEKTSVEYNNQINQSESINGLVQGILGILQNSLQTLEGASPLIDPRAFVDYINNLIKDIDPNTESLINESTIEKFINFNKAKLQSMAEQQGIDPSIFEDEQPQEGGMMPS